MLGDLAHVDTWIFDLDNTLYPAKANLFALIDVKMGEFIQGLLGCDPVVARETQKRYFMDHGTTLSGLMHHHGIDPREFLDYVHDISMDRLEIDPDLNAHIAALQGDVSNLCAAADAQVGSPTLTPFEPYRGRSHRSPFHTFHTRSSSPVGSAGLGTRGGAANAAGGGRRAGTRARGVITGRAGVAVGGRRQRRARTPAGGGGGGAAGR
jgi:hypothetical protein